jgi:hypothetical protein
MKRLTKRTPKGVAYMAIADTLPKIDQEIEGSKPVLEELYKMFQKLADYEDTEELPIVELRKCCEFCEYYEAEYDLKCSSCRFEDDEACNYSNFEVSKELIAWKENND